MSVFKRGDVYRYHFIFDGQHIQETTKQGNREVAIGMERAHRVRLAKERDEKRAKALQLGSAVADLIRCVECDKWFTVESGTETRDRKKVCSEDCRTAWNKKHFPAPTLSEFCQNRVQPWAKAQFERTCPANWRWYSARLRSICNYEALANLPIDKITSEHVADFARNEITRTHVSHITRGKRRKKARINGTLAVSTVNTSLRALRRVLRLAMEWGVITSVPKIRLLPGENHRERVLTVDEETKFLASTEEPLASIATILADSGVRPDECYQLRWENISFDDPQYTNGSVSVMQGKTKAAKRKLPMTVRERNVLQMLWTNSGRPEAGWVFPSATRSGHADHATVRKQHKKALRISGIRPFVLYSFRHTFLTRLGASGCDAWTLARIAGHSSIQISAKYVHPGEDAVLRAMARLPEHTEAALPERQQAEERLPATLSATLGSRKKVDPVGS